MKKYTFSLSIPHLWDLHQLHLTLTTCLNLKVSFTRSDCDCESLVAKNWVLLISIPILRHKRSLKKITFACEIAQCEQLEEYYVQVTTCMKLFVTGMHDILFQTKIKGTRVKRQPKRSRMLAGELNHPHRRDLNLPPWPLNLELAWVLNPPLLLAVTVTYRLPHHPAQESSQVQMSNLLHVHS